MIKKIYKSLLGKYKTIKCFIQDYKNFVNIKKVSTKKDELIANIMLCIHQLEKGMSFTTNSREFGGEKAFILTRLATEYETLYSNDQITNLAFNVLCKYLECNNSTKNTKYKNIIESYISKSVYKYDKNVGGTKIVSSPAIINKEIIESFYYSRSSVREFSTNTINKQDILSAMKIAVSTPSACNRQASRVHVITKKEQIQKIIENQLGDQGWCNNATTLFIITVNRTFFSIERERHQAFIDGGMYAMNFAMGLHLNNIASCFKMYINDSDKEDEFYKLSDIPTYEQPIVLLLAGYYKNTTVTSPKSERLSLNTQIYFHE